MIKKYGFFEAIKKLAEKFPNGIKRVVEQARSEDRFKNKTSSLKNNPYFEEEKIIQNIFQGTLGTCC